MRIQVKSLSPEVEVTKSLYKNLIKSGVVTIDGKEKRIIDSDASYQGNAFRPLVFERVEEVETEGEAALEEAASDEEITMESGLTQEQTDLLFRADSDEAAIQMLMNRKEEKKPASTGKKPSMSKPKQQSKQKPPLQPVKQTEQEIKKAKEEAKKILEEAKQEAETIVAQAKQEAQRLTENAHEQGFEQGYQEGMSQAQIEIEQERQQLEQESQQLQEMYEQQIYELEPQVVEFLAEAIEKLTGVVLSERKDIVAHLVACCLEGIERSNVYLIHVSKEDYHALLERKGELEQLVAEASEIRIIEDTSLQKNQCLIESDTSIYDSSLDLQLERLCEDLRILALGSDEQQEM